MLNSRVGTKVVRYLLIKRPDDPGGAITVGRRRDRWAVVREGGWGWGQQGVNTPHGTVESRRKFWKVGRREILQALCRFPRRYSRIQGQVLKETFVSLGVGVRVFHGSVLLLEKKKSPMIYRKQ